MRRRGWIGGGEHNRFDNASTFCSLYSTTRDQKSFIKHLRML